MTEDYTEAIIKSSTFVYRPFHEDFSPIVGTNVDLERALSTKIKEVNLSAFVYRLFHEDFSHIFETNLDLDLDF